MIFGSSSGAARYRVQPTPSSADRTRSRLVSAMMTRVAPDSLPLPWLGGGTDAGPIDEAQSFGGPR